MSRFFGTDGIRGRAGQGKLTDDNLTRMARAIGAHFGPGSTCVMGGDTRESTAHLTALISDGLRRQGVDVVQLGTLPTPGVALATVRHTADFGIMVTASHNPWHDNGVKLFSGKGSKLSDADQDAIEELIKIEPAAADTTGTESRDDTAREHFTQFLLDAVPGLDLSGLSIIADCANGAGSEVLPDALRRLGADPTLLGVDPDGRNINAECGSTHVDKLQAAVRDAGADIGIALDGDADRIIIVDVHGHEIGGDQIMARLATDWQQAGTLRGDTVVATVMSNLGLEHYLESLGLSLNRTAVGDRHVAKALRDNDFNLGGESSGHILMTDHSPTGDGCLAALCLLQGFVDGGQHADYFDVFKPLPQILKAVRYDGSSPLDADASKAAIDAAGKRLGKTGRVLVRASGTEPVIRVMAEGSDPALVSDVVDELCEVIAANA